jgi:phage/plasmid-associated DNA primase
VAFKERLRFVLFNGDFSKSKDFTLEDDLAREIPGILCQLIKAAPDVFASGDAPPASVLDDTADLMDENDVARPFIEGHLEDAPDAVTPIAEIEAVIVKSGYGADVDRIMQGIKARWSYGRRRVTGHPHPLRGLIGVRVKKDGE